MDFSLPVLKEVKIAKQKVRCIPEEHAGLMRQSQRGRRNLQGPGEALFARWSVLLWTFTEALAHAG